MVMTLELRYETNKQILDFLRAYFTIADNKENLLCVSDLTVRAVINYENKFPAKILDTMECALDIKLISDGADKINVKVPDFSEAVVNETKEGKGKTPEPTTLTEEQPKEKDSSPSEEVISGQLSIFDYVEAKKADSETAETTTTDYEDELNDSDTVAGQACVISGFQDPSVLAGTSDMSKDQLQTSKTEDAGKYDEASKEADSDKPKVTAKASSEDEAKGQMTDTPVDEEGEVSVIDILDEMKDSSSNNKYLADISIKEIETFAAVAKSRYAFIGDVTMWLEFDEDVEDLFCASLDAALLTDSITWEELFDKADALIESDKDALEEAFKNHVEGTENEGISFIDFLAYVVKVIQSLDFGKDAKQDENVKTESDDVSVPSKVAVDDDEAGTQIAEDGEKVEPLGFSYIPVDEDTIAAFEAIKNATSVEDKVELSMEFFYFNEKDFYEGELVRKFFTAIYEKKEFDKEEMLVKNKMKLSSIMNKAIISKGGIIVKINILFDDFKKELA